MQMVEEIVEPLHRHSVGEHLTEVVGQRPPLQGMPRQQVGVDFTLKMYLLLLNRDALTVQRQELWGLGSNNFIFTLDASVGRNVLQLAILNLIVNLINDTMCNLKLSFNLIPASRLA